MTQDEQRKLCNICKYRLVEHGVSWCYMFEGMLYNCRRFTPIAIKQKPEPKAEDRLTSEYINPCPAE